MHKQYRKIDEIGIYFVSFGLITSAMFLTLVLSEKFFPEWFVSGSVIGVFNGASLSAIFSLFYGMSMCVYSTIKDNYIIGLCPNSPKVSPAFIDFCINSHKLCTECNLSLIKESVLPFTNGGSNIDAKFGYELGLINEKEVKSFYRIF